MSGAEWNATNVLSNQAPLIFSKNAKQSPLLPTDWQVTVPDFEEAYCLPPTITGTFGTTTTFDVLKSGNFALYPQLEIQLSAITPPNGAVASWVDFIGFEIIDTVQCRYSNNILQTFTGHDLRLKHHLFLRDDKSYAESVICYGNRSNGQLYADAQGAINLTVPLRSMFWGYELSKGFPTKHFAELLHIDITFKQLANVVDLWQNQAAVGNWNTPGALTPNAGVASATILKQNLRITYASVPQATEMILENALNNKNGVIVPFQDVERAKDIIPIGYGGPASAYAVNIDAAKSPCLYFAVEVRPSSDLNTPWGMRYDNWQPIESFDLEGNQQKLIRKTTSSELLNVEWPRYFNGAITGFRANPFYAYTFSRDPGDTHNQWGSQYLGALHNPRLNVALNASATVNTQVDVTFMVFNTIQMKGQDAKRTFF